MTHDEYVIPRFSDEAIAVLGHLQRAGGTMRTAALYLRCAGVADAVSFSGLNELIGRRWVHVGRLARLSHQIG